MTDELVGFRGRRRSPKPSAKTPAAPVPPSKAPPAAPVPAVVADLSGEDDRLIHQIAPTISVEAVTAIETALEAAHNVGDYAHQNVPALLRAALLAFFDGNLELRERALTGSKKRVSTLLTERDYHRYERLFERFGRKKSEVLERLALTFIARHLGK